MFTPAEAADLDRAMGRIRIGEPVFPGLPNPPVRDCLDDADTICRYEAMKFIREWREAFSGDYAAQRNIAYTLSRGSDAPVMPNRVQGCAWRLIIFETADPEMGEGDVSNMELECGRLTEAGRLSAVNHAERIEALIRSRS